MQPDGLAAIVEEAAKKSGLIWVQGRPGAVARPVWHVWQDGSIYLLCGGIEQPAPEELGDTAYVTLRSKDKGSRLARIVATVTVVEPGTEGWDAVVPALLGKRLNLPDGDAAPQRWARECTLYRLTPTGDALETPDERSTDAHAAVPPPTPARTRVPRPLHLRGRPARNRGGR
jgi:hypothetical protein